MKYAMTLLLTIFFCASAFAQSSKEYRDAVMKKFEGKDIRTFSVDEFNEVLDLLNEAIDKYPESTMLHFDRGKLFHHMKRYNEAIADLTSGITNFLWDVEMPYTEAQKKYLAESGYYARGVARGKINDYEGAIEDYNEAISLDDKFINSYFNRGQMKINLNQQGSACTDFYIAESLGDKEVGYYIRLYCGK